MKILVSSGLWNAALCCVESLGRQGHAVHVLSDERIVPATASRFCAERITTPNEYDGEAYVATLMRTLAGGGFDLFIPISDRAIDIAEAHRVEIETHCRMLLPAGESIKTARDKAATMRLAERLGVPIPRSLFPPDIDAFPGAIAELGLPCVVKIPRSSGSKGVFIAHSTPDAVDFVRRFGQPDNWPFLQAYEPGDTADIAAVCDSGRIVAAHAFYCESRHMIGGTPPYVRSLEDSAILDHASRLAKALEWHGPLDFDFTRTSSGQCLLLELNPRFSGTISFGFAIGIDLPAALLNVAQGLPPAVAPVPVAGTRFRTGLQYEMQWWARNPLAHTRELVAGWLDRGIHRVARRSDPMLLGAQLCRAMLSAYKERRVKLTAPPRAGRPKVE